jgi:hypothetical protein
MNYWNKNLHILINLNYDTIKSKNVANIVRYCIFYTPQAMGFLTGNIHSVECRLCEEGASQFRF